MAEQKTTADYIDISEIPGRPGAKPKWPYDEWAKIPPGRALEVTDLLDGTPPRSLAVAVKSYWRRHDLGLVCMIRNDRAWIARPKGKP